MTSLQRAGAELLGILALIGGFILYWNLHNHAEQKIGATACIISTTEVKADVVRDDSAIQAAHAAQLSLVVQTYDKNLTDSHADSALLAQRLRDYEVRQSASAGARCSAPGGSPHGGLPAIQSPADGGPGRIADDTAAVLNACDADHAKLILVTAAYNDWRQRMIDLNATR
jgi:hypothetical protein